MMMQSLSKRVLEVEHEILPRAVSLFVEDRLVVEEGKLESYNNYFTEVVIIMKRRAILSVSDKTGIVELGRKLSSLDFEIVSTGGTARD